MNRIFIYAQLAALTIVATYGYGLLQYNNGWKEGRHNLVQQQQAKAQARLAKQTTRQQANDSKAAAADESGKATAEVITRDVIKYIKTPGRNVCTFDANRVMLKSRAVANANAIPGYDEAAVQAPAAVGQR